MKKSVLLLCCWMQVCFGTSALSLEEKIGQLLVTHFRGVEANEEAKTLIQDVKVGGIIYYNFSNDLTSKQAVSSLSSSLQKMAEKNPNPIPLILCVDQEGGIVARLQKEFTEFPGNRALGETNNLKLARESAYIIGKECLEVGINMNLSPVVDINSNKENPVIGIRSFGEEPKKVVLFGKQALEGYEQSGICAVLKHYPGHGDVSVDSHFCLPIVQKSLKRLEQEELLPFFFLAPFADAIMTAHILVPALDPDFCTTLSKKSLDYLRQELQFSKVVISDSLVMQGVLEKCKTVEEAAIQALLAGCDILLLGGRQLLEGNIFYEFQAKDVQRVHLALVNAVKEGRVPEARVEEALERVLELKKKYTSFGPVPFSEPLSAQSSLSVAKSIAKEAIKVVPHAPFSFAEQEVVVIAPELLKGKIEKTPFSSLGKTTSIYFFKNLSPSPEEVTFLEEKGNQADSVIFLSYNAWKNKPQASLIQSFIEKNKKTFIIPIRDPLDTDLFPKATLLLQTFSPSLPSLEAAGEYLQK